MMTNPLTELYELSGGGESEWWPGCVKYEREWYNEDQGPYSVWLYCEDEHSIGGFEIDQPHALSLVTDHITQHLFKHGLRYAYQTPNGNEYHFSESVWFTSLGEALKYTMKGTEHARTAE